MIIDRLYRRLLFFFIIALYIFDGRSDRIFNSFICSHGCVGGRYIRIRRFRCYASVNYDKRKKDDKAYYAWDKGYRLYAHTVVHEPWMHVKILCKRIHRVNCISLSFPFLKITIHTNRKLFILSLMPFKNRLVKCLPSINVKLVFGLICDLALKFHWLGSPVSNTLWSVTVNTRLWIAEI